MDEPLSALDSQTRELLMEDFIGLLADDAMGAVYVTHNLEEAVRLADRIVVLSRRPGRVREIVDHPADARRARRIRARGHLLALQSELWSLIRDEAIEAEREVACLTRAAHRAAVASRPPGRVSRRRLCAGASRYAGWLALALVIGCGSGRQPGLVNPLFLPTPARSRARSISSRSAAHSGIISPVRSCASARAGSLGTVAGVDVGLAMGLFSLARAVGMPLVSALFPIPKIALLPLLILWLGIGESRNRDHRAGRVLSTVIAVYSGVDNVPRNLIRMAQSFEVPVPAIVRKVIWPGALPTILAGFRITASIALLLVVSAEMIGAETASAPSCCRPAI